MSDKPPASPALKFTPRVGPAVAGGKGPRPIEAPGSTPILPDTLYSLVPPTAPPPEAKVPANADDSDGGSLVVKPEQVPELDQIQRQATAAKALASCPPDEAIEAAAPVMLPTVSKIADPNVATDVAKSEEAAFAARIEVRGEGYDYTLGDYYGMSEMAVKMEASDLHLQPGTPPRVRHRLDMVQFSHKPFQRPLSERSAHALLENLLGLSGNTAAKATYAQEGSVDFNLTFGDAVVRGNGYRALNGTTVALRFFYRRYSDLDFLDMGRMRTFLRRPSGLIVVTGPTGAAKTTTAAAMIEFLNSTSQCHIATMEDPIEYVFEGKRSFITQRSIPSHSPSFETALKYLLRQDPDVIFVGEMRDLPVMRKVLHAAESGHLVITTLHADSVVQAFQRFVGYFPEGEQSLVKESLASLEFAVINQKLIPGTKNDLILAYELLCRTTAVASGLRDGKYSVWDNEMRSNSLMQHWDCRLDDLKASGRISHDTWAEFLRDRDRAR